MDVSHIWSIASQCCQYPRLSTQREENFVESHGFGDFSPWLAGLLVFEPVMIQLLMAGMSGGGSCSFQHSQKAKREEEEGSETSVPSKACLQQLDYDLPQKVLLPPK